MGCLVRQEYLFSFVFSWAVFLFGPSLYFHIHGKRAFVALFFSFLLIDFPSRYISKWTFYSTLSQVVSLLYIRNVSYTSDRYFTCASTERPRDESVKT